MTQEYTSIEFRGVLRKEDAERLIPKLRSAMKRSPVRGDCRLHFEEGLEPRIYGTKCECGELVRVHALDEHARKFSYECHACGRSQLMEGRRAR